MGREIYYTITQHRSFTHTEAALIDKFARAMNNAFSWACDGFNFAWHWDKPGAENRERALVSEGFDSHQAVEITRDEGASSLHGGGCEIEGISKTRGCDWDAFVIFAGLVEISRRLPAVSISFYDEGCSLLRCRSLIIGQGKIRPDTDRISRWINYLEACVSAKHWKSLVDPKLRRHSYGSQFFNAANGTLGEPEFRSEIDEIESWLPIYEAQWHKAKDAGIFSAYEARFFTISPWLFVKPECLGQLFEQDLQTLGLPEIPATSGVPEEDSAVLADVAARCIKAADETI
jgi:hypothetical protein